MLQPDLGSISNKSYSNRIRNRNYTLKFSNTFYNKVFCFSKYVFYCLKVDVAALRLCELIKIHLFTPKAQC